MPTCARPPGALQRGADGLAGKTEAATPNRGGERIPAHGGLLLPAAARPLLDAPLQWDMVSEVLARGGRITLQGTGDSMAPWFHSGERVVIEYCSPIDFVIGDVVVYRIGSIGGALGAHRFIGRCSWDENRYLTVSNHSGHIDSVDVGCVLGRVVAVEKREGTVRIDNTVARHMGRHLGDIRRCVRSVENAFRPRIGPLYCLARLIWRAAMHTTWYVLRVASGPLARTQSNTSATCGRRSGENRDHT